MNILIQAGFAAGLLKNRDDYAKRLEEYGKHAPASAALAGDSLVRMIDTKGVAARLGAADGDVLAISFGGATPRTLRWFFEKTGYRSVSPGGLCAIFLSPMQLNKNNRLFERTLDAAFDIRKVFTELVPRGRWENVRYYILNDFLPLAHYKNQLKDNLKDILGKRSAVPQKGLDPSAASAVPATPKEMERWLGIYARENLGSAYALDDYQLDSLEEVIVQLQTRSVRVILVVPPASPGVLGLLGDEGVGDFLGSLKSLGREHGVELLDYLRENKGYEFQDAVHLILSSREDFSEQLAEDLSKTPASSPS